MQITSINSSMLAKMFLAGASNLDAKKEWINELNVFPVPDGDTGTNMTMTIMSAAREVSGLGETPEIQITLAHTKTARARFLLHTRVSRARCAFSFPTRVNTRSGALPQKILRQRHASFP